MTTSTFVYVPALKWKVGESRALRELHPDVHDSIMPLIDVQPAAAGGGTGTRRSNLSGDPVKLLEARDGRAAFVDLSAVDADRRDAEPLMRFFEPLPHAIPVVRYGSAEGYFRDARRLHLDRRTGVALRLLRSPIDANEIDRRIASVLDRVGVSHEDTDLLLDLATTPDQDDWPRLERTIRRIDENGPWRSLTLVAGSFPLHLGQMSLGVHELERSEVRLWATLRSAGLDRLRFGDYTCRHPNPHEPERVRGASASIRYAMPDRWIVFRGRKPAPPRVPAFDEYLGHCRAIRDRDYGPRDFSYGDEQIWRIAQRETDKPGAATDWVVRTVSRHISVTARDFATRLGA